MASRKNTNKDYSIPFYSRSELFLCALIGCICILLTLTLSQYLSISIWVLVWCICGIYLLFLTWLAWKHKNRQKTALTLELSQVLDEKTGILLKKTQRPVIIFNFYGTLLWLNDAACVLFEGDVSPIGLNVAERLGVTQNTLVGLSDRVLEIRGRKYFAESFLFSGAGDRMICMMLTDETVQSEMQQKYEDERVAVVYVTIDSMEDVLQSVHDTFSHAVVSVDACLKQWAQDMHGVIKSYDNDKYILFAERSYIEECMNNRFSILDEVRNQRIGDSMSVTVSIGVCACGDTLEEREAGAKEAVDLALQRGGDQAVVKGERGVEYYGGRTKSVFKRANIRSRAFASQLNSLIARADNVLIMGHRFGDFDSFGSAVGLCRLALSCNVKVNISVDMRDPNLLPLIRVMQEVPAFSHVFVDSAESLNLVHPDTLLILCDVNTVKRAQFAPIAEKVNHIAIIDHHRKTEIESDDVKLSFIDPSASSACELVTEMLDAVTVIKNLSKEEADMLLAGILLDTKQFTRNTGTRTFTAAEILRGVGANPVDAYNFFKTDPADLSKEARFHTGITIYRDYIAISSCDIEADESYRIIASKAADKMLMLKNVEASFTLVRIGEHIHISGRSNGKINVQLILEQLHGGGHFDVAGAQVNSTSTLSVLENLKDAIDHYLDEMVNDSRTDMLKFN